MWDNRQLSTQQLLDRLNIIPKSEIGVDSNITRVIPSGQLSELIEAATHEQIGENDIEKVVEIPQADVYRLRPTLLHKFEATITQAVEELVSVSSRESEA